MEDINCWEEKFESCIYSDRLLNKLAALNKLVKRLVDIKEVKKAIYYARKYHGPQMRKSGEPYYSHPIEVAIMLAEFAAYEVPKLFTSTMLQAALLHDTTEDTKATEVLIAKIFNQEVARHVEGLSRNKPSGKITSGECLNLLIKQQRYDTSLIKIFDRIHNIQTLSAKSPEKAWKILMETISQFVTLSIYLEIPELEKKLSELCLYHINQSNQHNFALQNRKRIVIDNSLLPALIL